jgi:hypothetical protein
LNNFLRNSIDCLFILQTDKSFKFSKGILISIYG